MADIRKEIERRRTFAIISHPDAGKTTLTEKLLLYGGAIQLAGSVKGKATARHAVSDWMELEKQRGISISSSVMQFEYNGYCINILDTPGHQDFSEDTYRTLMAADSAVMVIDAAKGIEPQTRKLFKICAMRNIPIFTFINKLDREARSPYDLMEELEQEFGIGTYPMNWPIGCGIDFKGVYDREKREILAFSEFHRGQDKIKAIECSLDDTETLDSLIGEKLRRTLCDDVELLDGAGYEFDIDQVRDGKLSPVFFGSALNNFGVSHAKGEYLVLMNNDIEMITEDWLEEMLGTCQRREVGVVGAKLYYPDDTVQHAGIVVGIGGNARGIGQNMFMGLQRARSGYLHKASLAMDYSAVTAACLMVKRSIYEAVGGFEEKLAVAFNDVDFCLKVRKEGYLVVYQPRVEAYHYESKSRGSEDSPEKVARFGREIEYMRNHWIGILKNGDPYYNPNFSTVYPNYALRDYH